MGDWRAMTVETLERNYNPRASVPDFEDWFRRHAEWSAAARARIAGTYDLRYGDGPLATLDVHPGRGADAPILVYVHGGYWRALDKRDATFVAVPFVEAGATVVNVNYDLCPAVTVTRIVAEIRQALDWVRQAGGDIVPGDRSKLHLCGHSAGAHLVAMCLTDPAAGPIQSATLISGVYELEPVLHISVNAEIRLDGPTARANSPTLLPFHQRPAMLIAVGDAEPEGWIAQSNDYHAAARASGIAADYWRLAHENHFSILKPFTDPQHPLVVAMKRRMGI